MSPNPKLNLLREMIRIRRVEIRCVKDHSIETMAGFLGLPMSLKVTLLAANAATGTDDRTIRTARSVKQACWVP